jgi:hypothetical protein
MGESGDALAEMGARARAFVRLRYHVDVVIPFYEAILQEAVARV